MIFLRWLIGKILEVVLDAVRGGLKDKRTEDRLEELGYTKAAEESARKAADMERGYAEILAERRDIPSTADRMRDGSF